MFNDKTTREDRVSHVKPEAWGYGEEPLWKSFLAVAMGMVLITLLGLIVFSL